MYHSHATLRYPHRQCNIGVTMSRPKELSYERVRELFTYDTTTDSLISSTHPTRCIKSDGYISRRLDGRQVQEHRIVYFYHNPDMDQSLSIDHINGIKHDNRIENLRLVTYQENNFNRSNVIGFSWARGGWRTYIVVDNKYINLGNYDNKLDARAAYLRAKKKYHKIEER